jgi:hypothetical protein
MCAVTTQVSVRDGSKMAYNLEGKLIFLSMIARLGKMPSLTEKMAIRIYAIKNSGKEMNERVVTEISLSKKLFLYNAASIPRKIARGMAIIEVVSARKSVLVSLQPMSSETGLPLARELPKSPRTKSCNHAPYLICGGRSSLSSFRKAATVSGVADCPKTVSATSPGKSSTPIKIITETIKTVSRLAVKRLNINSKTFFIKIALSC